MNKDMYESLKLAPINQHTLNKWKNEFLKDSKNLFAQNVCSSVDPFEASLSKPILEHISHEYQHKVTTVAKPITDQKETNLGWIFSALNAARLPFMKQYNIEEFEFSQGYLFYWHTIERCYSYINTVVNVVKNGEYIAGNNFSYLLNNLIHDHGGHWGVIKQLINRYGIMPKSCFVDSFSSKSSSSMNNILSSQLRVHTQNIIAAMHHNMTESELQKLVVQQMSEIFNIVGVCLGIPNATFTWEYHDKDNAVHSIGPITPIDFYKKYVEKCYNVDDKICLVNDPRTTVEFEKLYTIEYLDIVGGPQFVYNNQSMDMLMNLAVQSIKNGDAVWIRCNATNNSSSKWGVLDSKMHDLRSLFCLNPHNKLNKGDRLLLHDTNKSHAMLLTGVSLDHKGRPTKFRVEDSRGVKSGHNGYLHMTAEWFNEFTFEIVVDKKIVPENVMKVFDMKPIVLPIWDPMR